MPTRIVWRFGQIVRKAAGKLPAYWADRDGSWLGSIGGPSGM